MVYEQFAMQSLHLVETVDGYLAKLRKIAVLSKIPTMDWCVLL